MRKSIFFVLLSVGILLTSCHDHWRDCEDPFGPDEIFVFQSGDIEALYAESNLDVHIYRSQNPRVEVIGARNIAHLLDVIFHGRSVTITHNGCIRNRDLRIEIYTPGLYNTVVDGSGDVYFHDYNDVPASRLEINGSGDLRYMGDSDEIYCLIDGSGDVEMAGSTGRLDIDIDGSGDVEAFGMQALYVRINVDGSGDSEVWAEETLSVDFDGSGDVYYIGYPDIQVRGNGSGRLFNAN